MKLWRVGVFNLATEAKSEPESEAESKSEVRFSACRSGAQRAAIQGAQRAARNQVAATAPSSKIAQSGAIAHAAVRLVN